MAESFLYEMGYNWGRYNTPGRPVFYNDQLFKKGFKQGIKDRIEFLNETMEDIVGFEYERSELDL